MPWRQQLKRVENCAQRADSRLTMKSQLIAIVAAVLVVGCGESQPTAKAPDISIHQAAFQGNIEAVKQHLDAGADVNAKVNDGRTPLDLAIRRIQAETADLLRKHGGKTGKELKKCQIELKKVDLPGKVANNQLKAAYTINRR